jgi:hypothetical protein
MAARLTPLRLLALAAIVGTGALTSACGGVGQTAQAADPPSPVTYHDADGLSFRHPATWKEYPFRWAGELHFQPIVYLSTQTVDNPCSTHGSETTCGFPVRRLEPGGVLVSWQVSGIPSLGLRSAPGAATRIGGRYAKRVNGRPGFCRRIGADRTVEVSIGSPTKMSIPTQFIACLRGPNLARNMRRIDALLASTRFHAS